MCCHYKAAAAAIIGGILLPCRGGKTEPEIPVKHHAGSKGLVLALKYTQRVYLPLQLRNGIHRITIICLLAEIGSRHGKVECFPIQRFQRGKIYCPV